MKWTRNIPYDAGYYWFRANAWTKEEDKEIVYVGNYCEVDGTQYLGRCANG